MSKTDGHLYLHPFPGVTMFTASPCVAVVFTTKVLEFFLTLPVGWKSWISPYFTIGEKTAVRFCDKSRVENSSPNHRPQSPVSHADSICDTEVLSKVRAPFFCSFVAPHSFSLNLWSEDSFSGLPLLNFTADKSWAHRVQYN